MQLTQRYQASFGKLYSGRSAIPKSTLLFWKVLVARFVLAMTWLSSQKVRATIRAARRNILGTPWLITQL